MTPRTTKGGNRPRRLKGFILVFRKSLTGGGRGGHFGTLPGGPTCRGRGIFQYFLLFSIRKRTWPAANHLTLIKSLIFSQLPPCLSARRTPEEIAWPFPRRTQNRKREAGEGEEKKWDFELKNLNVL